MSQQMNFLDLLNVTSSAALESGHSPSAAQDGPMTVRSGPDLAPVSPSASLEGGGGFEDERHLWPAWFDLIQERRPPIITGEQSANASDWLDLVATDLEGADYAFGAALLRASGFEGAHDRPRWYFVAVEHTGGPGLERHPGDGHRAPGWTQPARSIAEAGIPYGTALIGGNDFRRPIEPGLVPVAAPDSSTVGRLRAFGNALDAETAAQFVGAVMEAIGS